MCCARDESEASRSSLSPMLNDDEARSVTKQPNPRIHLLKPHPGPEAVKRIRLPSESRLCRASTCDQSANGPYLFRLHDFAFAFAISTSQNDNPHHPTTPPPSRYQRWLPRRLPERASLSVPTRATYVLLSPSHLVEDLCAASSHRGTLLQTMDADLVWSLF